jgi:hypothetical protein
MSKTAQDLGLETLLNAMARGDTLLYEAAKARSWPV